MPKTQKYLLVIDKDPLAASIKEYFAKFNYNIFQYNTLPHLEVIEKAAALLFHCVSLQEFMALKTLNNHLSLPIIILSENKSEDLCVSLLEAGADDFLVKPLNPRELHARITAITRRVLQSGKDHDKEILAFAQWRLYPASRQLFDEHQQELLLSVGEYDLLLTFVRQPQQILGREFLLQATKNSDLTPFDRRIDVQISRLRQKIETNNQNPPLIKTIRNGGYLFTYPVTTLKETSALK